MPDNHDDLRPCTSDEAPSFHNTSGTVPPWNRLLQACWLDSIGSFLQSALEHDRTQHGTSDGTSDRLEQEVALLKEWAVQNDALLPESAVEPRVKGGREHALIKSSAYPERVLKITIGPEFGYIPVCHPKRQFRDVCHWFSTETGLPSQYFQRLRLLNELFPRCETQLAGFVSRRESLHAITAQRIAWGQPADANRISSWLLSQGFIFISAWTWFRPTDQIALFDVMEKNVMECGDPDLVPFDVIPLRCEGLFLEMMLAAVERLS